MERNRIILGNYHFNRYSIHHFAKSMQLNNIHNVELCAFASYVNLSDSEDVKRTAELLTSHGIAVDAVAVEMGGVVPFNLALEHPDVQQWTMQYAEKAVKNIHFLDTKKLILSPGRQSADRPLEEGWERSKKNLIIIGEWAQEADINICLTCDGREQYSNIITTSQRQLQMINEVNNDCVKAYLDYAGICSAGEKFESCLMDMKGKIGHVCVSDGPDGWLYPGDGKLNVTTAMLTLNQCPYSGNVTLKLSHWRYDFEPDWHTKELAAYTEHLMGELLQ